MLDQWENDLTNDVFATEEEVETCLTALTLNGEQSPAHHEGHAIESANTGQENNASNTSGSMDNTGHASNASGSVESSGHASQASNTSGSVESTGHASNASGSVGNLDQANSLNDSVSNEDQLSHSHGLPVNENQADHCELPVVEGHGSGNAGNTPGSKQTIQKSGQSSVRYRMPLNSDPKTRLETLHSFDSWIDDLVEFQETVLPKSDTGNLTIADAPFKLQANKDIPSIQLPYFDGNALSYTDFVDQFKIHIHDKVHLADETRMIQLRMQVTGESERAIAGLGSKGIMYATALKSLKEQFGQSSVIARAVVNKLTMGDRISKNNPSPVPSGPTRV